MLSEEIKEMFPDWETMKSDNWSDYGRILPYSKGRTLEMGLYKESDDDPELVGTYTLQVFDNDDIIFCQTVDIR